MLYRYSSARSSWPDGEAGFDGIITRQEEFWFQMMVGLPQGQAASTTKSWEGRHLDFHDWLPENRTDRGYLYELGRRGTWDEEGRLGPDRGWGEDAEAFRQFTVGYHWESHLDRTLPGGLELQVPSPWLVEALGLEADPSRPGVFKDAEGRVVIICERNAGSLLCMIRQSEIDTLLAREALEPVWFGIGERSVYPRKGSSADFCRRRWNGVLSSSKRRAATSFWAEDSSRSV